MFYCNAGMKFYYHMVRSSVFADEILSGEKLVTYSDFSKLQVLTRIFTDAKSRCEMMSDVPDLPYDSAEAYVDCMLDECSILKKIYLSKQISVTDLCCHVDSLNHVVPDDFNSLFMPDYPPEIKEGLESFESKAKDRLDLLYAQVIVSVRLGF